MGGDEEALLQPPKLNLDTPSSPATPVLRSCPTDVTAREGTRGGVQDSMHLYYEDRSGPKVHDGLTASKQTAVPWAKGCPAATRDGEGAPYVGTEPGIGGRARRRGGVRSEEALRAPMRVRGSGQ